MTSEASPLTAEQQGAYDRYQASVDRARDFVDRVEERRRGAERALAEREAAAADRLVEVFSGGQEASVVASVTDRTAQRSARSPDRAAPGYQRRRFYRMPAGSNCCGPMITSRSAPRPISHGPRERRKVAHQVIAEVETLPKWGTFSAPIYVKPIEVDDANHGEENSPERSRHNRDLVTDGR
jgi:hypothetical protein